MHSWIPVFFNGYNSLPCLIIWCLNFLRCSFLEPLQTGSYMLVTWPCLFSLLFFFLLLLLENWTLEIMSCGNSGFCYILEWLMLCSRGQLAFLSSSPYPSRLSIFPAAACFRSLFCLPTAAVLDWCPRVSSCI